MMATMTNLAADPEATVFSSFLFRALYFNSTFCVCHTIERVSSFFSLEIFEKTYFAKKKTFTKGGEGRWG